MVWGQSEGTGESEGKSGKRTRVWAQAQVQAGERARVGKDMGNKHSMYCGPSTGRTKSDKRKTYMVYAHEPNTVENIQYDAVVSIADLSRQDKVQQKKNVQYTQYMV